MDTAPLLSSPFIASSPEEASRKASLGAEDSLRKILTEAGCPEHFAICVKERLDAKVRNYLHVPHSGRLSAIFPF